jgi:hypothetical protein
MQRSRRKMSRKRIEKENKNGRTRRRIENLRTW